MKILVVEDDPDISSAVREGLDEAGYYTTVVRDGARALTLVQQREFSLILLDLMLPGMDGMELCRKLRAARNNIPILMVTARDAVEDRVAGLNSGADDYLPKPFDFEELLARVRALLRRDKSVKSATIHVDDLTVDVVGKRVQRNGVDIHLTGREYTLLEALAQNEGQILSREAIQERVWLDESSISNVVDVYIRTLRRKLEPEGSRKLIHTVHGLGYSLHAD